MTMNFLDALHEITENKYSYLRVSKAVYFKKESAIFITLLVPYNVYGKGFKDEDKTYIHDKINEYYKGQFTITLSYEKSYCNDEILMNAVVKYFESHKPSILLYLKKNDIKLIFETESVKIEIDIHPELKLSFDNNNILSDMKEYLSHLFCDEFCIRYTIKDEEFNVENIKPSSVDDSILSSLINGIPVTEVKTVVGGAIISRPISIKSSTLLKDDITVCGKIIDFKRIVSKTNRPFYIFTISDTTGTCEVKSFARTEKDTDVSKLEKGAQVLVSGKLSIETNEKFKSKADISLIGNKISTCEYDEGAIVQEEKYHATPERYTNIFPKQYKTSEQGSIMAVENAIPPYLLGKSFVVFDLETTGLGAQESIVEIGAVKIVDGRMRETFDTLVNPNKPIPPASSAIHKIYDDMVQDAPKIESVIGDFYKFCDESIIISYNIAFDMPFIKRDGEKCGYKFDHRTICALRSAQAHIKSRNHTLDTVTKTLGIQLNNAHRALDDTIAAAKVFIKVAEYMQN